MEKTFSNKLNDGICPTDGTTSTQRLSHVAVAQFLVQVLQLKNQSKLIGKFIGKFIGKPICGH